MRFETMLARKYISAQKRHSALTICSIAVALTLMSMLFTGYATLNSCLRASSYELQPYHMCITSLTAEQSDKFVKLDTVESYNKSKSPDGTYQVEVMFKKRSIKDIELYLQDNVTQELGISLKDYPYWRSGNVIMNRSLMNYDYVDDDSMKSSLQKIAIFYVFIVFIALALRLIIDTAFEVSSKERERQFGVLQSIGATPKQIVRIMTAEGLMLSAIGIPIGLVAGIGVAYIAFRRIVSSGIADAYFTSDKAEQLVRFHVSIPMLILAAITGLAWVLFSAYGTGMRVIKKSPVEAISARSNTVKKVRRHTLMGLLFGWTGKLTSRNARRQPKRFIVTILSLTISLALFAGTGSAMNYVSTFIEASLNAYMENDLYLDCDTDPFTPDSYRDVLEKLEKSGYFSKYYLTIFKRGTDKNGKGYYIYFESKDDYEKSFLGEPPMSYEELAKSGGYILVNNKKEPDSITSLDLEVAKSVASDKIINEYREETKRLAENPEPYYDEITETTKYKSAPSAIDYVRKIRDEGENTQEEHTFKIVHSCKAPKNEDNMLYSEDDDEPEYECLIATLDQYDAGEHELFGNFTMVNYIECDLKDAKSHKPALKFIEKADGISLDLDIFEEMQKLRTTISAYSIAAGFVTGLIALIAVVNMINIVSTGIVNRRSELASMQCVGMTRGQLYKMAAIEGLQYTLFSAIGAALLCMILIFLTKKLFVSTEILTAESIDKLVRYSEPIIRVGAAAFFAFIVSIVSAVIPLRLMQKTPLVDQIRSVD